MTTSRIEPIRCAWCGEVPGAFTTSMFNEDVICLACKDDERTLPRYVDAVAADEAAMRQGDYNFAGIGLRNTDRALLADKRAARSRRR